MLPRRVPIRVGTVVAVRCVVVVVVVALVEASATRTILNILIVRFAASRNRINEPTSRWTACGRNTRVQ